MIRPAFFQSIKIKLFFIITIAVTSAILATALLFYLQITSIYRQTYLSDLENQAAIIGNNCQAALTFGIPEDAEAILSTLSERPSITYAVIVDTNGKPLAEYHNSSQQNILSPHPMSAEHVITIGNVAIGTIRLIDNMTPIYTFQKRVVSNLAIISLLLISVCALIVFKLSQIIARPTLELAALASRIAEEENYNLRAASSNRHDEIGQLADSFNAMLATITVKTDRLEASNHRFQLLVDQGVDAFFLHDDQGKFIDVNQQACKSLGYSRDELLTMSVADIDGDSVARDDSSHIWSKITPGTPTLFETHHKRKDGTTFPVEVRLGLFHDGDRTYIMGLARDISDRFSAMEEKHELELQIQQAQKMEAIGTLAGGIAHDFNNILAAIMGYSDLALMSVDEGTQLHDYLKQISQAGNRATALVKQILTFSRKHHQETAPLQISLIIKEALKLLRASIPTTITIKQDIRSQALALADPTHIHQIMMNISTNAYHAMAETGGTLSISLKEIDIEQPIIDAGEKVPPGHYLVLSISDTGEGMDKETRDHIFEPYFTTKGPGKGTGLGLAVVHGIVMGYNGRIGVYSEPGKGTTFNIYLPALSGDSGIEQVTAPNEDDLKAKHGERVMFVDDEEAIRDMASQILRHAGYTVETFLNGQEAWEKISTDIMSWNLIITDLTMPKMTGDKLADHVLQLRPDMPVIICSGNNEAIQNQDASNKIIYANKPLSRLELLALTAKAIGKYSATAPRKVIRLTHIGLLCFASLLTSLETVAR